jgi:hypothetical protein
MNYARDRKISSILTLSKMRELETIKVASLLRKEKINKSSILTIIINQKVSQI